MRGSPRDPRTYELMTVFAPDVPEDEIQGTIDRVVGYITTATGEVTDISRDSPWGRRRLAYPIRHQSRDVRDGFYTLYHFSVAPHRIEDIERELKLNDRVIRYLVTQYTPKPIDETAQAEAPAEGEAPAVAAEVDAMSDAPAAEEATPAAEVEATNIPATMEPVPADEAATVDEANATTTAEPVAASADESGESESAEGEADTEEATPPKEA